MTIRTSISLSTPAIETAVNDVARQFFRKNKSSYIESLIIEDLVKRGMDRSALLDEQGKEKGTH
jgi:hypothetical protein